MEFGITVFGTKPERCMCKNILFPSFVSNQWPFYGFFSQCRASTVHRTTCSYFLENAPATLYCTRLDNSVQTVENGNNRDLCRTRPTAVNRDRSWKLEPNQHITQQLQRCAGLDLATVWSRHTILTRFRFRQSGSEVSRTSRERAVQ